MTDEMTGEMKMYKLYAPGYLRFCCVGQPNYCRHCYIHLEQTSKINDLFQNLLSKRCSFHIADPKTALIGIPSTIIPLQASLLRNDIPIELLKIVENYYGRNGGAEALLYPMIAKMIFMLQFNYPRDPHILSVWRLPYHNISPKDFTSELYWNFAFGIGILADVEVNVLISTIDNSCSSTKRYARYIIDPVLFYTIYKETNNIGDKFIIPTKPKDSPPSLVPHSFYDFIEDSK
jgi:hypothetical protein